MEKQTPHCKLSVVKALLDAGKVRTTKTALMGAVAMGLDAAGLFEVVKALVPSDFYKSMTAFDNHRVWQDVYRPATPAGAVYVKLTVVDDLLIVSFKEL